MIFITYFLACFNFGNMLFCLYTVIRLSPTLKKAINLRTEMKNDLIIIDATREIEETLIGTNKMVVTKGKLEELITSITKEIRSMYCMELGLYLLISYSGSVCVWETMQILESKDLL